MPQVLVGLAIIGTVGQAVQQRKMARIARRESIARQNIEKINAKRNQMSQLARMRALQGQITNVAEQTGATGSAAEGMLASVTSSAADNVSYLQQGVTSADYLTSLNRQSISAQSSADLFGAVGGLADTFASATGAYEDVFTPKTPTE